MRPSSPERAARPDRSASLFRAGAAEVCVLIAISYILFAGWPSDPFGIYIWLYIGTRVAMFGFCLSTWR